MKKKKNTLLIWKRWINQNSHNEMLIQFKNKSSW
jgi:hypothetical protein